MLEYGILLSQDEVSMALHPEKMREIVFLLLFSMTHHAENDPKELQDLVMSELKVSRSSVREGLAKVSEIITSLPTLDALISEVALSFSFERIQAAELAVLRLAFWELFIEKKLPPKIVFSEATRLLKKFAQEDAVPFVHALLVNACGKQGIII